MAERRREEENNKEIFKLMKLNTAILFNLLCDYKIIEPLIASIFLPNSNNHNILPGESYYKMLYPICFNFLTLYQ